jgi:hypothetical protein
MCPKIDHGLKLPAKCRDNPCDATASDLPKTEGWKRLFAPEGGVAVGPTQALPTGHRLRLCAALQSPRDPAE